MARMCSRGPIVDAGGGWTDYRSLRRSPSFERDDSAAHGTADHGTLVHEPTGFVQHRRTNSALERQQIEPTGRPRGERDPDPAEIERRGPRRSATGSTRSSAVSPTPTSTSVQTSERCGPLSDASEDRGPHPLISMHVLHFRFCHSHPAPYGPNSRSPSK